MKLANGVKPTDSHYPAPAVAWFREIVLVSTERDAVVTTYEVMIRMLDENSELIMPGGFYKPPSASACPSTSTAG